MSEDNTKDRGHLATTNAELAIESQSNLWTGRASWGGTLAKHICQALTGQEDSLAWKDLEDMPP